MPTAISYSNELQLQAVPESAAVMRSAHREGALDLSRATSDAGADTSLLNKKAHNAIQLADEATVAAIKSSVQTFLDRFSYRSPQSPQNPDLRRAITAEILSWDDGLSEAFVIGLAETTCTIVEASYTHTSYEHQFIVALYTAYLTYADDIAQHNMEAVGGFVQRLTQGQAQPVVAFDRLTTLLGTLHEYYPRISANAIIANTLDFFTGTYTETVTQGLRVHPAADRYPFYLRLKTGVASAYAHLMFTKNWGEATGNFYLQLLPELELVICGINDILSFYKETLAGETDNYVHLRAAAEQKDPIAVLQEVIDENLESLRKIAELATCQTGLADICHGFLMGYIEFHFNARRYRLDEIVDVARYAST